MNGIGLFSFRFSSDFESPGPVGVVCNRQEKPTGALMAVRCRVSRAQLAPTVRMTVGIR